MTRRDRIPANRRGVTIAALEDLCLGTFTFFPRSHLICEGTAEVRLFCSGYAIRLCAVTRHAGRNRYIRIFHKPRVRVLRYTQMAGRAVLIRMIRRLMFKSQRVAVNGFRFRVRLVGKFMTSRAVRRDRFDA